MKIYFSLCARAIQNVTSINQRDRPNPNRRFLIPHRITARMKIQLNCIIVYDGKPAKTLSCRQRADDVFDAQTSTIHSRFPVDSRAGRLPALRVVMLRRRACDRNMRVSDFCRIQKKVHLLESERDCAMRVV